MRKRASNFSTQEVEALMQIIESRKNIIACKNTDRASIDKKEACWDEVTTEFNSLFDSGRSTKVLKEKYKNIKTSLKRKEAEARKMLGMSANEQTLETYGMESANDSDKTVQTDDTVDIENYADMLCGHMDNVMETETAKEESTSIGVKYSPAILKTTKRSQLKTAVKPKMNSNLDKLALTKIKCCEKICELKVKEHEMNIKEHKMRMQNYEEERTHRLLEHKYRIKNLKKEHKLQMSILQYKLKSKIKKSEIRCDKA